MNERRMKCDVLVVGGGMAALFAAIKAREKGADVIVADKGYAGKSGQSPYATGIAVYNPDWGHNLDAVMARLNRVSEYVNNRYWGEVTLRDSYARYRDLLSWGVAFKTDANGRPENQIPPADILTSMTVSFDEKSVCDVGMAMRRQALRSGVRILDRVMISELIKQDGRIAGAVGLTTESFDPCVFAAKTTILCVGAASFKPAGYPPLVQLTGDGEGMAFRAGAELIGKEFVDVHFWANDIPTALGKKRMLAGVGRLQEDPRESLGREEAPPPGGFGPRDVTNAFGRNIPPRGDGASTYRFTYPALEFEANAGRAPLYMEGREVVGGAALGMSLRKADGVWPADERCATSLPGLYAAGDALGTMQNGAAYALPGSSLGGSAVTGAIAGTAAAEESLRMDAPAVDEGEVARAVNAARAPADRESGFGPRWVTQLLQNTMMPYFVSFIKKEDRLEAALNTVLYMQENLVPKLYARDPHELRLAHETRNMVLNAEMRLRSALFRTESRGNHYREDYPARDDENWLVWTKIKGSGDRIECVKVPVPESWRPDMSVPYARRYPYRFPDERV